MRWVGIAVLVLAALVAIVFIGGMLLPVGHVASVRAEIPAPVDEVYRVLTDVEAAPSWRNDLDRVTVLSGPDEPLRWRESGRFGDIVFVVEEATPPHRWVGRIDSPGEPFGGRWIYELEGTGAATTLTITEDGEVYNPVFRFLSRFVFGHYRTLEAYVRDLGTRFGTSAEPVRVR